MKHLDAIRHVRGESRYVDDVPPPEGMLYAAVLASPLAHGRILALDGRKALQLPGVVAVLTAENIPAENQIGPILPDQPLLAEQEVQYEGEPVALVVATTPWLARKAVGLVELELEPLPAVLDPIEAFQKGLLIGQPRTFQLGDVESAWEHCEVIVEGECDIGGQEHVYLETQRARAIPLEEGQLRIESSTQSPFAVQRHVAQLLGIPAHAVEVDVKRLGGGFGGKEDQATPWACLAALAAWHTRRPVELVLNRAEDMLMTGKRHPYRSRFKLGARRDGTLLAYQVEHYQNAGAVADLSPAVLERTMFHSTNSYFIPNVHIFAASCRTNLPPFTAFRGFGGPQGMFVMESALTRLAEKLGLPREAIQEKNLLREGDPFPYGQRAQRCRAERTWQECQQRFHYQQRREAVAEFNRTHFARKKGLALMPVCFGISFTSTFLNQAGALVHVYADGSVSVSTGGVEMGQGLSSNLIAIASRALGISARRIKIETTNTTRVANMSPSAASATTVLNGNAMLQAIGKIQSRLKELVCREFNLTDPRQIEIAQERVLVNGHDTGWDWARLVRTAYLNRVDLSAHGYFATPNIYFNRQQEKGRPFAYHVYGTALIQVELDCLRGTYRIESVKIVHDLGRPLNRLVDLGQVEGGLAQGLGWMTLEELRYDDQGRLMSRALASYKVPDVYFMPDDLEVHFLENVDEPTGPYGNKAVGEPPLMYGIGAFFALRDAMRAFRPELQLPFHSPLTPERVLTQLHPELIQQLATAPQTTGEPAKAKRKSKARPPVSSK